MALIIPSTVSSLTLSVPATTWALVMIVSGVTAKPVPCSKRLHCSASPTTRTIDPRAACTTGEPWSSGFGGSTSFCGRLSSGSVMMGKPLSLKYPATRAGRFLKYPGTTDSTPESTVEPFTERANSLSRVPTSGTRINHTTTNVVNTCTTAPTADSAWSIPRVLIRSLKRRPRPEPTAYPSTTPTVIIASEITKREPWLSIP